MTSSNRPEQLRLFAAVALPSEVREVLARAIGRLRDADLQGVRTVAPEGVHVTLKFLGNVDTGLVPSLSEAFTAVGEGVAPFELALQGVGAFPDERAPRALWAGIAGNTEELAALAHRVDEACATLGFPRERRAFMPHLTIARLRDSATVNDRGRAAQALAAIRANVGGRFTVDALHLIKSTLTPAGPTYQTLHTVHLRQRVG